MKYKYFVAEIENDVVLTQISNYFETEKKASDFAKTLNKKVIVFCEEF